MNPHSVASTFERGGLALAGALHNSIQSARARRMAADEAQAHRNLSATQRAVYAVERQRAALVASQQEAARLWTENATIRTENAKLRDELARMRSRALEAEGRLVRLAKASQELRAA